MLMIRWKKREEPLIINVSEIESLGLKVGGLQMNMESTTLQFHSALSQKNRNK